MEKDLTRQVMPEKDFAALGGGTLAYVKPMSSDQLKAAFPQVEIAPGLDLWALLNADGTPIMVADNRDDVVANAWEHDLTPVSLH